MNAPARSEMLRLIGAALVLVGGAIHVKLAFDHYGTATLEDLFFANAAVSAVVAAAIVGTRGVLAPLAGVAVAASSLVAFGLSRVGEGIAGFRATGLEPAPEGLLTLVVEVLAVAVLGLVVASHLGSSEAENRAAPSSEDRRAAPG